MTSVFTIAYLWWPIVLAVVLALVIWYWSTTASHRIVERISAQNPKLYNFRFRQKERQQSRRK